MNIDNIDPTKLLAGVGLFGLAYYGYKNSKSAFVDAPTYDMFDKRNGNLKKITKIHRFLHSLYDEIQSCYEKSKVRPKTIIDILTNYYRVDLNDNTDFKYIFNQLTDSDIQSLVDTYGDMLTNSIYYPPYSYFEDYNKYMNEHSFNERKNQQKYANSVVEKIVPPKFDIHFAKENDSNDLYNSLKPFVEKILHASLQPEKRVRMNQSTEILNAMRRPSDKMDAYAVEAHKEMFKCLLTKIRAKYQNFKNISLYNQYTLLSNEFKNAIDNYLLKFKNTPQQDINDVYDTESEKIIKYFYGINFLGINNIDGLEIIPRTINNKIVITQIVFYFCTRLFQYLNNITDQNMSNEFGRSRRWSTKYKRSINCKKPKGFSQKQYCTYGRKK